MNTHTKQLHDQGLSLWLDNITRKMLDDGTIKRYINELSVTGLTSNPTIFDNAITHSNDYDDAISAKENIQLSDEELFFNNLVKPALITTSLECAYKPKVQNRLKAHGNT